MSTTPNAKRLFTQSTYEQANAVPLRDVSYGVDSETQMRLMSMAMRVRKSVDGGYKTTTTSTLPTFPSVPSHPQASFTSFLSDSSARSLASSSSSIFMDTSPLDTLNRRRRRSRSPPSVHPAPSSHPFAGSSSSYNAAFDPSSPFFPAAHEAPPSSTLANRPIRTLKRALRPTQSLPVSHSAGGGGWISEQGRQAAMALAGGSGGGVIETVREEGAWTGQNFEEWAKRDDGF